MEWLVEFLKQNAGKTPEEIGDLFNAEFPKHAVPKDQYNKIATKRDELTAELEGLRTQADTTAKTLEELKAQAGQTEETKLALAKITSEHEEYKKGADTRLANVQKQSAIREKLLKSNAAPDMVDILAGLFDLDKISTKEGGDLDGFDSQFEAVKTSRPSAFAVTQTTTPTGEPIAGTKTLEPEKNWFLPKEQRKEQ